MPSLSPHFHSPHYIISQTLAASLPNPSTLKTFRLSTFSISIIKLKFSRSIIKACWTSLLTFLPTMPPMPYFFLITTIFYKLVTTSSSNEITYTSCANTYSCGGIENISYPFAGGDRPDHCGLPAFKLTCQDNTTTLLTHNSATFRVLSINQPEKTLTLVRDDLYNTTCPLRFFNTTLNSTLFTIADQDDMLTLIYGCNSPPMPFKPPNQFTCRVRNVDFTDAYGVLGPVPTDPILWLMYYCSVSVTVPVLREVGARLTSGRVSLREALKEGFYVNYSDPYEMMCRECKEYGGECGFDSNLGVPLCVCGDRPCPLALVPQSPHEFRNNSIVFEDNKKKSTALSVGLGIAGVVIVSIGLGWLIFFCRRRRKRVAVAKASLSPEAVSKEIITTTSSKALISSTTSTFTTSIPSYPSSKSDLGRGSSYFGVQIFSYSELEEATDNFSSSRELGDGGFGAVYYGTLADGRVVAVKRLYENNFKRQEQFMNEVEILARLRHKNLVHLYGCTSKRSRDLLLVYEYIPNGTVADHLHGKRAKSGLLSWPVRLNIAIETAEALAYLHKSDIIHRDVKSTNILLDNEFHVKVADFGLSRLFPNDVTHVSTAPQGTPGYVDPEYYQVYRLTERSDVFSFGVVLIELISSLQAVDINRHRHDINLANMAVNKIQTHALHELVDQSLGFETNNSVRKMTSLVAELAFRCLQQERDVRPSMQEVLETLRGIQKEDLEVEEEEFVEIMIDDVALLKGNIDTPSPGSADKSAKSTTPNSV